MIKHALEQSMTLKENLDKAKKIEEQLSEAFGIKT